MTTTSPQTFSLDHVLARNISVHWDEAVAVVEELCSVLTAGAEERPVPELGDILIAADGAVTLQRGARGTKGASAVGRTLHALLSSGDVPVALRLFVTQATSLNTYASLRECAAALAYFGKPDRAELIRGLHERCAAVGDDASATMPGQERPPVPETTTPETKMSARRRRIPAWAAVAAGVACLFGIGMWLWSANRSGAATGTIPLLAAQTKKVLQQLGTEARTALGVAVAAKRVELDEPASRPAPAPPARARRARRDPHQAMVATPPVQATAPFEPAAVVVAADTSETVEPPSPEDGVQEQRLAQVYTRSDLDVRPPLLVYPQLPPQLVAGSRVGTVNTMEIVVSESGTVLHVRLIDGPRRMPDMMLLSGAKNWRFTPAVKDGGAVRYRTVVSWLGGP